MTKLCPRGKAAAKRKFKVYPSAYANAYASKICAGKIKDPSGVKRKVTEELFLQRKNQKIKMSRPGLYANIHAKRKRGGKMRKKGAKGAPTAANFARAKQTARKR